MSINIRKLNVLYTAEATVQADESIHWSAPRPMTRDELILALRRLGCHQTDMGDAFYDADPDWLSDDDGAPKA